MKLTKGQTLAGLFLLALSVLLIAIHNLIFKDPRTLVFYLFEDLIFLPIEILIVTLIIQGFLNQRQKQELMAKLNMVIEVFYSEMGTSLIGLLVGLTGNPERGQFQSLKEWSSEDFTRYQNEIKKREYTIGCSGEALEKLRLFLLEKRDFSLRLLENPNLLEHETFTDLLWAVFHLTEELSHRIDCRTLQEIDREHVANDIKRAYDLLVYEWLGYMRHLKQNYPYLFSLAVRLNPFDPEAKAEVV